LKVGPESILERSCKALHLLWSCLQTLDLAIKTFQVQALELALAVSNEEKSIITLTPGLEPLGTELAKLAEMARCGCTD